MSTNECSTHTAIASPSGTNVRLAIATSTAPYTRKPTRPSSVRNCSGVECGSTTASGLLRSMRSVRPNVPAPGPGAGWSVNAFHASCHQRHRLLELVETTRPGALLSCALTGFENSCQRSLAQLPGPPARTTEATSAATTSAASTTATTRTTVAFTARVTT